MGPRPSATTVSFVEVVVMDRVLVNNSNWLINCLMKKCHIGMVCGQIMSWLLSTIFKLLVPFSRDSFIGRSNKLLPRYKVTLVARSYGPFGAMLALLAISQIHQPFQVIINVFWWWFSKSKWTWRCFATVRWFINGFVNTNANRNGKWNVRWRNVM